MALVEVSGSVLCVSIWSQLVRYSGGGMMSVCTASVMRINVPSHSDIYTDSWLLLPPYWLSVRQISVPKQTRRKLQWRKSLLTCDICYLNSTWGQENRVLTDSYRVIVSFNESYRKIGGMCTHDQNQPFWVTGVLEQACGVLNITNGLCVLTTVHIHQECFLVL